MNWNKVGGWLKKLFQKERWLTDEGVEIHYTDEGKIWVKIEELVKTESFKQNLEQIRELREKDVI